MTTKSIIQDKVLTLDAAIEDLKNEYPRNMADCWRKRTPLLIVALLVVVSLGFLSVSVVGGMIFISVFPVVFWLAIRSLKKNKYTTGEAEQNARVALMTIPVGPDKPDVAAFVSKTSDSINNICAQKKKNRNIANLICLLLVASGFVWSISVFLINSMGERGVNANLFYLGIEIGDTFQATHYGASSGLRVGNTCTFRIEDHQKEPYFRFEALDLDVKGADAGDILILKFVDSNGLPLPYFPEFIFSGSDAASNAELYSSSQRDLEGDMSNNFVILKTIKEGGIYFTLEKMRL